MALFRISRWALVANGLCGTAVQASAYVSCSGSCTTGQLHKASAFSGCLLLLASRTQDHQQQLKLSLLGHAMYGALLVYCLPCVLV
jgi:hypothetical protein